MCTVYVCVNVSVDMSVWRIRYIYAGCIVWDQAVFVPYRYYPSSRLDHSEKSGIGFLRMFQAGPFLQQLSVCQLVSSIAACLSSTRVTVPMAFPRTASAPNPLLLSFENSPFQQLQTQYVSTVSRYTERGPGPGVPCL